MKKVLLVNSNNEKAPYPVPPVGLCMLASSIKDKYEVKIYDGTFDEGKNFEQILNEFAPDFVGVSIRNIDNMNPLKPAKYIDFIYHNYIKTIKKNTSVPIILGGSGFSIFPDEILKQFDCDYGIIGEGEYSFIKILDNLSNGNMDFKIPGVLHGQTMETSSISKTYNLNEMEPLPMDLLIDFRPYRSRGAYSIQTKRGCSHNCIYCTYTYIEGKNCRTRSSKSIADEIEKASQRLGDITFEFVDSTFNDPPGHAEAICREIASRKLNVRLRTMGINPSNSSEELFELMLEAGFTQIDCTPDSASKEMLVNYQKNFSIDELQKTAEIIKKFDIPTMWFFIFGGPGESRETIDESFAFIDKWVNKKDMVHMTEGLRVYPNTPLYELLLGKGTIKEEQSLLEPLFYFSEEISQNKLSEIIKHKSKERPNCIPSAESKPSQEMMLEAMKIREEKNLTEPVFRTLINLRYKMFEEKKIMS